mmetsp:Transcript_18941/g.56258  ORF Transcript_18941/g.56258 Transcript_18941/m.56258 type:complete len:185 (-) Transcript_18941:1145-1699(-)
MLADADINAIKPRIYAAQPFDLSKGTPSKATVYTTLGEIVLKLRPDAAPQTVAQFAKLAPLLQDCCFYRSDFVIQGGLQTPKGAAKKNPLPPIPVNETRAEGTVFLSNVKGTAAFGHWDVPDNGNSDWFINLKDNPHLDDAYGGYAVFAAVDPGDVASNATVEAIGKAIAIQGIKPKIRFVEVE